MEQFPGRRGKTDRACRPSIFLVLWQAGMQRQEANDIGTADDDKEDDDGGRPVSFCGSAHGWSVGLVTVTVVMARWSSYLYSFRLIDFL